MLLDNQSYIGSISQVFSIDENPVYAQSSQFVQFEQVLQVGVQTGGKIHVVEVEVGVGVGVGVTSIMVEHSCIWHSHPQVSQDTLSHPQPHVV
jgi:hypothetical protein